MVCYCKKCGFIGVVVFNKKCNNCGTKLNLLSEEMKQKYHIFNDDWSASVFEIRRLETNEEKDKRMDELLSLKDNFIKNEVANNPLFSMEEYENQVKKDKQSLCDYSQYQEPTTSEWNFISGYYYCKKCGRVVLKIADKRGYIDDTCDYCKSKLFLVPEKYWFDGKSTSIENEQIKLLREELVKTTPEFDEYLFNHRDSDLQQRWSKTEEALEHGRAVLEGKDKCNPYGVTCPNCKATNVRRITVANKAVHTAVFGLWSVGRNVKNYHCDHCGSEF